MSYCRVCGYGQGENDDQSKVRYRAMARQTLCDWCSTDTPAKVSRETFDRAYWKRDDGSDGRADVPESTRREFYSDYLSSTYTLAEYIDKTSAAY